MDTAFFFISDEPLSKQANQSMISNITHTFVTNVVNNNENMAITRLK